MGGFEFVFSLFGLLLGLSLAEVIAGFGRAVEAKLKRRRTTIAAYAQTEIEAPRAPRIGWLTPLLGLFVTFNLVSFWTAAWAMRDQIPVLYLPMLFGLLVTGGYYFAAAMVFPREISALTDLDEHYFEVKRWVVAVVIGCNLVVPAGMALAGLNPFQLAGTVVLNLIFYMLLIALLIVRGKRINLILLAAAAAAYPVAAVVAVLVG